MTAAERLKLLSGTTGTAAALLLSIGVGATTGDALNAYSSISTGTAAEHLLSEKLAAKWDTRQGVSPIKFTPLHDADVPLIGCGAEVGSGVVAFDLGCAADAVPSEGFARTGSFGVSVAASSVVDIFTHGATSGSGTTFITTGSTVPITGYGARGAGSRVMISGDADVAPIGACAFAGASNNVSVLAIQNPTDEELIFLFKRLTY